MISVADPDPAELRKGGVGSGFVLLALPAFLPSVISFFTHKEGGGGGVKVLGPPFPPLDPLLDIFRV